MHNPQKVTIFVVQNFERRNEYEEIHFIMELHYGNVWLRQ